MEDVILLANYLEFFNHESLWKHQLFFKRSDIQRTKRETDLDPGYHLCFQISIGNIYIENRNRNFLFELQRKAEDISGKQLGTQQKIRVKCNTFLLLIRYIS